MFEKNWKDFLELFDEKNISLRPNFKLPTQQYPGFLTSFGLNLLGTPPRGNIFQTAATAAKDPFNRLQADQAAAMKTAGTDCRLHWMGRGWQIDNYDQRSSRY